MSIYDNSGGGRRGMSRLLMIVLLVLALIVGTLFVVSGAVPWFNPGVQYNNEDASGGPNPAAPVP